MLSQSIPWEWRHHFSLIPDLAAGKVSVAVERMRLSPAGLWKVVVSDRRGIGRAGIKQGQHFFFHMAICRVYEAPGALYKWVSNWKIRSVATQKDDAVELGIPEYTIKDPPHLTLVALTGKSQNDSDNICELRLMRPRLLWTRWMNIAFHCGFDCYPLQSDWSSGEHSHRFTVDFDLRTKMPGLEMTWSQFVYFILGLGVDPCSLADIKEGCSLRLNENFFLRTSRTDGPLSVSLHGTSYRFSLRTALAAAHIMLLEDHGNLYMASLREHPSLIRPTRLGSVSGTRGRFFNTANREVIKVDECNFRDLGLSSSVTAALIWALYNNTYGNGMLNGATFVSPEMIKIRNSSLFFLYRARSVGVLEDILILVLEAKLHVNRLMDVLDAFCDESPDVRTHIKLYEKLLSLSSRFQFPDEIVEDVYSNEPSAHPLEHPLIQSLRSDIVDVSPPPVYKGYIDREMPDSELVEHPNAFMTSLKENGLGTKLLAEFQPSPNVKHAPNGDSITIDNQPALAGPPKCDEKSAKSIVTHNFRDVWNPLAILANVLIVLHFWNLPKRSELSQLKWHVREDFLGLQDGLKDFSKLLLVDPDKLNPEDIRGRSEAYIDQFLARCSAPSKEDALRILNKRGAILRMLVRKGCRILEEGIFEPPESPLCNILKDQEHEELLVHLS